jgi:hypothetical protein
VIVFDDGSHEVIAPPGEVTLSQLSGYAAIAPAARLRPVRPPRPARTGRLSPP